MYWAAVALLQKNASVVERKKMLWRCYSRRGFQVLYTGVDGTCAVGTRQLMRQSHSNHLHRLLAIVSKCESRDWAVTTVAGSYGDCKEERLTTLDWSEWIDVWGKIPIYRTNVYCLVA